MDHPKRQISNIVHHLTTGSPVEQRNALESYFLPNASFIHPLCRISSFSHLSIPFYGDIDSRWVIWMIYRWYKILSPRIILEVECTEFNQEHNILFLEIHQIFSLYFVPFYESNVHLTTKLHLSHEQDGKYYIREQEDLYQLNDLVKFLLPGGATVIWLLQFWAAGMCILGAFALAPVTWWQQRRANGTRKML